MKLENDLVTPVQFRIHIILWTFLHYVDNDNWQEINNKEREAFKKKGCQIHYTFVSLTKE